MKEEVRASAKATQAIYDRRQFREDTKDKRSYINGLSGMLAVCVSALVKSFSILQTLTSLARHLFRILIVQMPPWIRGRPSFLQCGLLFLESAGCRREMRGRRSGLFCLQQIELLSGTKRLICVCVCTQSFKKWFFYPSLLPSNHQRLTHDTLRARGDQ